THTCDSEVGSLGVKRGAEPPVVNALPCVNAGLPGTATFSVQPQAGVSSYIWNFQSGFAQETTASGSSVTVHTLGAAGTYWFSVTTVSSFDCEATTSGLVTVSISAGGQNFADLNVDEHGDSTFISVPSVAGFTYQLYDCLADQLVGSVQTGNGEFHIGGTANGGGSYAIQTTTTCATIRSVCKETVHVKSMTRENTIGPDGSQPLHVMPNPNDGTFALDIPRDFLKGTATLTDGHGRQVGTPTRVTKGMNTLRYNALAPGVYQLRVELDGRVETQRIVIGK
ncbi:MAG TPA: T9SS type A sorting domain-containing protein, partial [Flavobacteriales bacterium]|nr:T9SS type A sorting domain-containing protein [Flavobacteriales bacterium]